MRGLVVALFVAGCSFDTSGAGTDPSGSPDSGASVGGAADPDASAIALVEQMTVPGDGGAVTSTAILRAGVVYHLVVSGTVDVFSGRWFSDADWFWDREDPTTPYDTSSGVDLGLALDTESIDPVPIDWGVFSPDHVYRIDFLGKDAPVEAHFQDPNYENNGAGSLTLEIHGPPG